MFRRPLGLGPDPDPDPKRGNIKMGRPGDSSKTPDPYAVTLLPLERKKECLVPLLVHKIKLLPSAINSYSAVKFAFADFRPEKTFS